MKRLDILALLTKNYSIGNVYPNPWSKPKMIRISSHLLMYVFLFVSLSYSQTDSSKTQEKVAREQAKKEREQLEREQKEKYKYFAVTSEPSGARVEINGEFVGITPIREPVKVKFYYSGPTYAFSSYLQTPLNMTVSKDGYVAKTLLITKGPYQWVSLNGVNRLYFHVVTQPEFHVQLEKVGEFLGTNPFAKQSLENSGSNVQGATESVIQRVLPAVVTVTTSKGSGSGFFILESGVIVTNRHVVESETSVKIITSKGEAFTTKSIFVHPSRDLALLKVGGSGFPSLAIADPANVNIGADVIAVGSPGLGSTSLQNSVTKGIISAFRSSETKGFLIQTDAALNHGNSGGPLLNLKGEVVGVNTFGYVDFGKEGLSFSLFCSEILEMLKQHFDYVPAFPIVAPTKNNVEKITVNISSMPEGAEIHVDGKFVGSTPSKIALGPGAHTIKLVCAGYKDWAREIQVELGSEPNLRAILEKLSP